MAYHIDKELFFKTFKSGKDIHNRVNEEYNMFPFALTKSDDIDSFDDIMGAFFRALYSLDVPTEICRESIISDICNEVECSDSSKSALKKIIKDLYFIDEKTLRCNSVSTYKYAVSNKNYKKISEYIVGTMCDSESIKEAFNNVGESNNILDSLVESHLPKLETTELEKNYISLIPQIKEFFTKDLIFIIKEKDADFFDITQLISYYYFFYTSQVMLNNNRFGTGQMQIFPVYFCTEWEKTSKSRRCYIEGWKQIDINLKKMASHSVLLEILNQTSKECTQKYSYDDLLKEYEHSSKEEKNRIFNEIQELNNIYTDFFINNYDLEFKSFTYEDGDLNGMLKSFFEDISFAFEETTRCSARDKYMNSFKSFCKSNYLQNRKAAGLILTLSEETLVLMTKVAIGNEKQMRLNTLFEEFNKRGIYMDNQTKESVIGFYEKLNIIEKKSDSGDAQYVKGIL